MVTAPDPYAKPQSLNGMDLSVNDFSGSQGTAVLSPETSVMSNELPPAISFAEKPEFPNESPIQKFNPTTSRSLDAITLDTSQIAACFHLYVLKEVCEDSIILLILTDFLGDIIHISHFWITTSRLKTIITDILSCFG